MLGVNFVEEGLNAELLMSLLVPLVERIAKISPVGPVIAAHRNVISNQLRHGASDQRDQHRIETCNRTCSSAATRVTCSSKELVGAASVTRPRSSLRNFSWFSRRTEVTAFL